MFVFPLGLQARTRDFPWMTVAILVVTAMYSVLCFDVLHKYLATSLNDPASLERLQKEKILVSASCVQLGLTDSECQFVREEFHPEKRETEHQLLLRILESRAGDLAREQRKKLIRLIAKPAEIRALLRKTNQAEAPEFEEFDRALRAEDRATMAIARAQNILTRGSLDVITLLRSLFVHAGWTHLIGNMVFFLMFAIPLEARVGALALAMIYFVGGASGMALELFMSTEATRPVLGASAAVSAVAASFLVAFWQQAVRVFVSLFLLFNQIVMVPAWMFFLFFVLIHDVSGALSPEQDGVAHIAHLGGFGIGALLGAVAVQIKWMMPPFVFPFELKMFVEARQIKDRRSRLIMLLRILYFNPGNTAALIDAWRQMESLGDIHWAKLSVEDQSFLKNHLADLLKALANAREKDSQQLSKFFELTAAADWQWEQLINRADLGRLMSVAHELRKANRMGELASLAQILVVAHPESRAAHSLVKFSNEAPEKLRASG